LADSEIWVVLGYIFETAAAIAAIIVVGVVDVKQAKGIAACESSAG